MKLHYALTIPTKFYKKDLKIYLNLKPIPKDKLPTERGDV